jgi:hypothetical protein
MLIYQSDKRDAALYTSWQDEAILRPYGSRPASSRRRFLRTFDFMMSLRVGTLTMLDWQELKAERNRRSLVRGMAMKLMREMDVIEGWGGLTRVIRRRSTGPLLVTAPTFIAFSSRIARSITGRIGHENFSLEAELRVTGRDLAGQLHQTKVSDKWQNPRGGRST